MFIKLFCVKYFSHTQKKKRKEKKKVLLWHRSEYSLIEPLFLLTQLL